MKLLSLGGLFLLAALIYATPAGPFAQSTVERLRSEADPTEQITWPAGPTRDSVPAWAKNGAIRFARWDGGRIETAKAILSGWPNFWPPDPNVLYATDNWYDPKTVQLLREAGVNMIWVTSSNGFSNQTEKLNQDELRRYIAECHRQGIHVMAYESISNMFWQDMFKNVPESQNWPAIGKDGKPVPYGAAAYKKIGYISRYMANLSNPEWQAYLRRRVDLALDAGADGVDYDNNFARNLPQLMNIYEMIYKYGSKRKKDFLLMGNFHSNTYGMNRLTNSMTTEDGAEPGIYDADHLHRVRDRQSLLAVGGGYLISNGGLFRALDALSEGWKLNLVEDGRREYGQREAKAMSPERSQLAMAEAMSFGAADELFVEDALATALWNYNSDAGALWKAIAQYNHFFAGHEAYYTDVRSMAPLAVVLDDTSRGVDLLNGLAARNVLFDVIYEHDLKPGELSRYSEVALLTAETVSDKVLAALEDYVRNGGRLFVTGRSASLDEQEHKRPRPPFFGQNLGKGECAYSEEVPARDQLAGNLRSHEKSKAPGIEAPPGVAYNVVAQPSSHRVIVHLLNYGNAPVSNLKIDLKQKCKSAMLMSPDLSHEIPVTVHQLSSGAGQINVPSLKIYSMLVLNQ
jgi:Glycosyl hydrolase family 66